MTTNLPAPEWFDPKRIIASYLEGKSTDTIAKEIGVKREKLVHQLTKYAPDDWRDAQAIRQIRRMEEAEDAIDEAAKEGDYQKVKANEAKLRSAQWALEKVLNKIYGEVKEKPQTNAVQININLRRPDGSAEVRTATAQSQHVAILKAHAIAEEAKLEGYTTIEPEPTTEAPAPQIAEQPKQPKKKSPPQAVRNPDIELPEPGYQSIPVV